MEKFFFRKRSDPHVGLSANFRDTTTASILFTSPVILVYCVILPAKGGAWYYITKEEDRKIILPSDPPAERLCCIN